MSQLAETADLQAEVPRRPQDVPRCPRPTFSAMVALPESPLAAGFPGPRDVLGRLQHEQCVECMSELFRVGAWSGVCRGHKDW